MSGRWRRRAIWAQSAQIHWHLQSGQSHSAILALKSSNAHRCRGNPALRGLTRSHISAGFLPICVRRSCRSVGFYFRAVSCPHTCGWVLTTKDRFFPVCFNNMTKLSLCLFCSLVLFFHSKRERLTTECTGTAFNAVHAKINQTCKVNGKPSSTFSRQLENPFDTFTYIIS